MKFLHSKRERGRDARRISFMSKFLVSSTIIVIIISITASIAFCMLSTTNPSHIPGEPFNQASALDNDHYVYLPGISRQIPAWRPFSNASPWNTVIPANIEVDPSSEAMINTLQQSVSAGQICIALDNWTVPVYYADADTPTYTVPCVNEWNKCYPPFGPDVPIPDDAIHDPEQNGHMVVVDLERNLSWDMYGAQHNTNGWQVTWGYVFDLAGDGVQTDRVGSARGSGFPLIAGLIRLEEIEQGHINHALALAYDEPRKNIYVHPASVTYAQGDSNAIPMGGHIRLDPDLNLDDLNLSPAAHTIARALQRYGAYVADVGGGITLYAEGLYGKPDESWEGILTTDALKEIPWYAFEVLELPPLKTMLPEPTPTPTPGPGRWFSEASPWNTPIETNPSIDPNSATMIATFKTSGNDGKVYINLDQWTIPVYYADENTPLHTVRCVNPWGVCGSGFGENVPIPPEAMPDPTSDGHMVVVDQSRQLSWDMYQAQKVGDSWQVLWGYVFDLQEDGVQPDGTGSCRGSGFPLVAGLIMKEEIEEGYIDHALVMAYNSPREGVYVNPASTTDGRGGPNTIPEGARIQLDPNLDLDSLGLSPRAQVVARALQEYGAYMGDIAGGIALFGEGLYGKSG
ncbi:MAG: hypothetical protein JW981_08815, partial [Anaerolineae bacterium]|nr:hypothetical protein [Anaerolineae bacterium]